MEYFVLFGREVIRSNWYFFFCAKLWCCLLAFPCVLCASRPGSLEAVRTLVSLARVLVISVGLRLPKQALPCWEEQ